MFDPDKFIGFCIGALMFAGALTALAVGTVFVVTAYKFIELALQ